MRAMADGLTKSQSLIKRLITINFEAAIPPTVALITALALLRTKVYPVYALGSPFTYFLLPRTNGLNSLPSSPPIYTPYAYCGQSISTSHPSNSYLT
jgi:hypothetical protein